MGEMELTTVINEYMCGYLNSEYSEYGDWKHTDHENYIDKSDY